MIKIREKYLGYMLILLVAFSTIFSLYFGYEQGRVVSCQARVNSEFLSALKQNSALAEYDRDNLTTLVSQISQSSANSETQAAGRAILLATTPEQVDTALKDLIKASAQTPATEDALQGYLTRKAAIDSQRKAYPQTAVEHCGAVFTF